MSKFVKLKKLYENGMFVGDCVANWAIVNCSELTGDTPKPVWLNREKACCGESGIKYTLTFIDPENDDALTGMWIVVDGHGVMVDANDVDNIIAACETCCDGDPVEVTTEYTVMGTGVSTFDEVAGGTEASYCITRDDDGSPAAQQKFALDYYGKIKSFTLFSASGTESKYTVVSVVKPVPVLTDTIANGACA